MAAAPLVSVITPCFNNEEHIGLTLRSLQSQTWRQWECIVIDDGSRDRTSEIVSGIGAGDTRIRLLRQENSGPSVARNRGLKESQGDVVLFLDGDDWIADDMLAACMEALNRSPGIAAAYTDQMMCFVDLGEQRKMPGLEKNGKLFVDLACGNRFAPGCVAWRRPLFDGIGGFDPEIPGCEDWDCFVQLARLGTVFQHVPQIGLYYRRRSGSLSSRGMTMWRHGLTTLGRSFAPDPRVTAPDPEFAAGCDRSLYAPARRGYAMTTVCRLIAESQLEAAAGIYDEELAPGDSMTPPQLALLLRRGLFNAAALPRDKWSRFWSASGATLLAWLVHVESARGERGFAGETVGALMRFPDLQKIEASSSYRLAQCLARFKFW